MNPSLFLSGNKIEGEPNLLFDKADPSAAHGQVYWGLRRFGPYDKDIVKTIRLAHLAPAGRINDSKRIVQDLNGGTDIMPGGMPAFFRCKIEEVDSYQVDSIRTQDFIDAANRLMASHDPRQIDVVLCTIPWTSRYFKNTPYYRLKSAFTTRGFVTQMITEHALGNLKWSYLNLASSLFAKAGGIPWVLESEMKETDMILGVDIAEVVSLRKRIGALARFVGFVNVFDRYGRWLFFEGTGRAYERGKNFEQLQELLQRAIERFQAESSERRPPRNIVIHYYKRFGYEEMEYVKQILKKALGDFKVAFISIDSSHAYRLYDLSVPDGGFPRGAYAYLSNDEILLSTTGFTELAKRRMGTPKLLHIKVKQFPADFLTLDDIALQVLSLTKLDWATATPLVREPVTMQFSQEIAYLTGAITEQEWEGLSKPGVNEILSRRTWFI